MADAGKKMHIAIDAALSKEIVEGLEVYALNLIKGLAAIDRENRYTIYGHFWRNYRERAERIFIPKQENFSLMVKRFPQSLMNLLENKWHFSIQERWLQKEGIDIFHGIGGITPILKKIKSVVTIYDLSFEINPGWYRTSWYRGVHSSCQRADKIIAVSQNTKKDLIRIYNIPPQKIEVIYGAADGIYQPMKNKELFKKTRQKYNLPPHFILTVSATDPRKNIEGLIHAYARLGGITQKLVIAGKRGIVHEAIIELVKELKKDVIFTGYLPQEDLVAIYNMADLFVFPSLYEGFGLPVLEAMACGTPVITSNISSLPEVAGEAAMLIDPNNTEEMAQAMKKVLSDDRLQEEMREKGLARARLFSWERTAREALKVYRKVYS